MAAKDLIPAAMRWSTACAWHSRATGDDTLVSLPAALEWRIDQVLRSRDRLLTALSVPQNINTMDDALTELDQILVWLMAAFDITAQVAHVALGVPMKIRQAVWQYDDWLKKVADLERPLADLLSNGNEGEHVFTIVRELRNSVHGEAMSAGGMIPVVGHRAMETLVRIPRKKRQDVLHAMDELGGHAAWGVARPFPDSDLHLHPGEFIERLLPRALSVLNDLMSATPVERLAGVQATSGNLLGTRPQSLYERRIRWQLGL
jgi:hypothetical protein